MGLLIDLAGSVPTGVSEFLEASSLIGTSVQTRIFSSHLHTRRAMFSTRSLLLSLILFSSSLKPLLCSHAISPIPTTVNTSTTSPELIDNDEEEEGIEHTLFIRRTGEPVHIIRAHPGRPQLTAPLSSNHSPFQALPAYASYPAMLPVRMLLPPPPPPLVPLVPLPPPPPPPLLLKSPPPMVAGDVVGGAGNPCAQPQQVGSGPYRIPRWFYNPGRMRCELFYWSGCCANGNNFMDHTQCEHQCEDKTHLVEAAAVSSSPTSFRHHQRNRVIYSPFSMTFTIGPNGARPASSLSSISTAPSSHSHPFVAAEHPCFQELDPGHVSEGARRPLRRYYFNQDAQLCQEFHYSGVGGNANNFVRLEECQRQCRESPNPCAYGLPSTAPIQCEPGSFLASTCQGQQFCHVGASPTTTICCKKPPVMMDPCQQPLNIGIGNAQLNRYYYNAPAQQCQNYVYRGLQGNENNFLTLIECEAVCQVNPCARGAPLRLPTGQPAYCTAQSQAVCPAGYYCHLGADTRSSVCCQVLGPDACNQPVERGQGQFQLQRWYWDPSRQSCLPFIYLGQKGTQNNFLSREDCERICLADVNPCRLPAPAPLQQCVAGEPQSCGARHDLYCHVGASAQSTVCCPADATQACVQPMERGVGAAALDRWFFNAQLGQCQPFTYAGLKGNQNNFLTREECEWQCQPNPCPFGRPAASADGRAMTCAASMASTAMSTCPAQHWCHVGADQSTTVCCPEAEPNACMLPMSTGEGPAQLDRWYYDSPSRVCKPFTYHGLKGNQNNYLSQRACQLACQPLQGDNPCIGQPAVSPTGSGQLVYCAATNRDTCPVNFWCHLGATPETTVCCPGATNACSVPMAPGTGNARVARWYYSADDRECVEFEYNGRRGNQNNFLTQEECRRICPEQLCMLSIDRGACGGRQTRYAFNRQSGQCVPFEFTGCGGNLNNFLTMADCQATCGAVGF